MRTLLALSGASDPTGELARDLHSLVARRARIFEHIAPFRRATRGQRERSAFVSARDSAMAALMRANIESVVLPHIDEAKRDLVEVLDVLLSFDTWDRLRTVQGLSAERAEAVLQSGARALLGVDLDRARLATTTGDARQ